MRSTDKSYRTIICADNTARAAYDEPHFGNVTQQAYQTKMISDHLKLLAVLQICIGLFQHFFIGIMELTTLQIHVLSNLCTSVYFSNSLAYGSL